MITNILLLVIAFALFIVALSHLIDLLAHISRYRQYIHSYPATRMIRGKVWKQTR